MLRSLHRPERQTRSGVRPARSPAVLARVTYPALKAVKDTYATEATPFGHDYFDIASVKVGLLETLYGRVQALADGQVVSFGPVVANGFGVPDTARGRSEWMQTFARWHSLLNASYFAPAPELLGTPQHPRPPHPGPLPPTFAMTAAHERWMRWRLGIQGVARHTGDEQARTEVFAAAGRLVRAPQPQDAGTPVPVDTADSMTWAHGLGWEIFALSHDGHLHMSCHIPGLLHHSSLLDARDVAAAGELRVRAGVLEAITPKTGHYQASWPQMRQLVNHLHKGGVDLAHTQLRGFDDAVIAASVATWWSGTQGRSQYEYAKTRAVLGWFDKTHGAQGVDAALAGVGWQPATAGGRPLVKPDGSAPTHQEVRRALKAAFPADRWEPSTTMGALGIDEVPVASNLPPVKPPPLPAAPHTVSSDYPISAGLPPVPVGPPQTVSSDYTVDELGEMLRRAARARAAPIP